MEIRFMRKPYAANIKSLTTDYVELIVRKRYDRGQPSQLSTSDRLREQ